VKVFSFCTLHSALCTPRWRLWLAAILLLGAPAVLGAEPADWIGVNGASAERVPEPVFGGNVMLYRAGRRDGEAVVLIHGLGQNGAQDWSKLIPALAERYDVYALDLPGFGQSDKGNHLYSPDNFARVIEAVVARHVSRPFVLIGHSMGGAVSLGYAAAYPSRVNRMILVDMAGVLHRSVYSEFLSRLGAQLATGVYPEDAPWFSSLVRTVLTRVESIPFSSQIVLQIPAMRQRLLKGDPNAIAAYALVEHDFSRALRGVKAPTLVIWGSEDRVAPLRTGELAAATIPGARLAVIRGAGHIPQLQVPQQFNPIVLDELQGRSKLAPYALPRREIQGDRVASCDGQSGQRYNGDYRELSLSKCANAQIANARVGVLKVTDSDVRILNSHIRDGVEARNSRLELTGVALGGGPALVLDASSVDAAGTRFESGGGIAANRGTVPVTVAVSVSEALRGGAPRYVHEVVRLAPGNLWQ